MLWTTPVALDNYENQAIESVSVRRSNKELHEMMYGTP